MNLKTSQIHSCFDCPELKLTCVPTHKKLIGIHLEEKHVLRDYDTTLGMIRMIQEFVQLHNLQVGAFFIYFSQQYRAVSTKKYTLSFGCVCFFNFNYLYQLKEKKYEKYENEFSNY